MGCIMHMYLYMSSSSPHLVGRNITLLKYPLFPDFRFPLLVYLINFLLFFSVSLLEINKLSGRTESIFRGKTCSSIVISQYSHKKQCALQKVFLCALSLVAGLAP